VALLKVQSKMGMAFVFFCGGKRKHKMMRGIIAVWKEKEPFEN
jgi:hypothetical protein